MRRIKSKIWWISVGLSGGLLLSFSLKDDPFEIAKQIEIYADFFKTLNQNYVEDLSPSNLNTIGIKSLLEETDPYTIFVSQRRVEQSKLQSEINSSNIGIRYAFIDKKLYITSLKKDSPADQKGLKIGDEITAISGFKIEAFGEQITTLLNGSVGGADINLSVYRKEKSLELSVPVENTGYNSSVPLFKKINSEVGYIALQEFNSQAYKEVRTALEFLKTEGVRSIVLDLRGNPGGLLDQAVKVVSLFVPEKTKVVTVRGKRQKYFKEYFTKKKPIATEIPIVVLVDGHSASSSEIVAGSLQDLDRAVIVGQKSFGKGLVQQYFDLKYDTQIKITIARYYTPSGRCIQALDYSEKNAFGEAKPASLIDQQTLFKTQRGRPVFGGGGVMPDIIIDAMVDNDFVKQMKYNYLIFSFVNEYFKIKNIKPDFKLSDDDWQSFKTYYKKHLDKTKKEKVLEVQKFLRKYQALKTQNLARAWIGELNSETIKSINKHRIAITKMIQQEIFRRLYDEKTRLDINIKEDMFIAKTISILKEGEYQKVLEVK